MEAMVVTCNECGTQFLALLQGRFVVCPCCNAIDEWVYEFQSEDGEMEEEDV